MGRRNRSAALAQRSAGQKSASRTDDRIDPVLSPASPSSPSTIRRASRSLDSAMGEKQFRLGDHLGIAERLIGIALAGLAARP